MNNCIIEPNKLWKDLFQKKEDDNKKNVSLVFVNSIGTDNLMCYLDDKIPQSVIKKSKKDYYQNK